MDDTIVSELEVLRNLAHKNIVKLHEYIQHPKKKKFYLVMDYLPGGTINDALEASGGGLPVEKVRQYFRQLCSAVHYSHFVKNIVHRDIKPENCLIGANGQLILCDFGVSQFFQNDNDAVRTTRGTIRFLAPEAFKTGLMKKMYGKQLDIWAVGITLFNMLTNSFPFEGKNIVQLQANILTEEADLTMIEDSQIKDLLTQILNKDQNLRVTIYDILQHSWVTNNGKEPVDLDLERQSSKGSFDTSSDSDTEN